MSEVRKALGLAVAVVAVVVASGCQPVQPWRHSVASGNSAGTVGGNGFAIEPPVFSPDGTKLAFVTTANDLGPADSGEDADIYVRDLATGTHTLVSVNAGGTDGGDEEAFRPTFSADGTKIAFQSAASDLVAPPADGGGVYVRDLESGTTTLIGPGAGTPEFSPTEDKVAYGTGVDVWLHDLATGTSSLVSVNEAGTGPGNGPSQLPNFSPDGTKIAFQSFAGNLVTPDTNGTEDVFVRDLTTGTTTMLSRNAAGTNSGNQHSYIGNVGQHVFSADGTKAVFTSLASDLVGLDDDNLTFDVFLHDLTTGTTSLVSVDETGTASGDNDAMFPRFSPDGTRVVFAARASDLEPIAGGGEQNVFVRDIVAGTTTLVSVNADGTDGGNGPSGVFWNESSAAVFSSDSRRIVFPSRATDLGPKDSSCRPAVPAPDPALCTDVYVRDLATATTTLVSANAAGDDSGNLPSSGGTFGTDPDLVAFVSSATDLGPTSSSVQVYLARLTGGDLSVAVSGDLATPSAVSYEVDVANAGPDPADDATVALLLPEQATFVDADSPCTPPTAEQPRLVTCPLGTVTASGPGPGSPPTIEIHAQLDAPPGSTVTAVAAISSPTVDPVPNNNTARADLVVP